MQCFLKSKYIKVELSMIKIGELLRKLWSLRSCFLILPPGALSPQGIKGAVMRDVSKHLCTLQWWASRGWVIAHENWTSWEIAKVCNGYSHMRGPGIGCWFSDRSNCSHWSFEATVLPIDPNIYTDQWWPIFIYHSTTLLVIIQLCSPLCWRLDSNYCRTRCWQSQLRFALSPLLLHLRLLGTFQSDIPLFTLTSPAKHSPNQGWESTHSLHLYPMGDVFYSS